MHAYPFLSMAIPPAEPAEQGGIQMGQHDVLLGPMQAGDRDPCPDMGDIPDGLGRSDVQLCDAEILMTRQSMG
ncbi:hypothetical protein M5C99_15185 [Acidovorax sp. NCPPB 2350]|nr:hypothetical protein M5C99_15185 [Acidovorax sp. NCPPB 2350]